MVEKKRGIFWSFLAAFGIHHVYLWHSKPYNISLGDIRYAPTRWVLALFLGFVNFCSNTPKCHLFGGGVMCILFEICEKRLFQKCRAAPPPLCNSPPAPGGEPSLGPKSIENTRRQRRQRKFLQGAEADLHCDTMVQICGATPPPPRGEPSLHDCPPPPPRGNRPDKRGEIARGGG